jgi:hypothetical protein
MGAWAHCRTCSAGMALPSISEAINDSWQCESCGAPRDMSALDRNSATVQFENTFSNLLDLVEQLAQAVDANALVLSSALHHITELQHKRDDGK